MTYLVFLQPHRCYAWKRGIESMRETKWGETTALLPLSSASHLPTVSSLVLSAHRGTLVDQQVHSGRVPLGNDYESPLLEAIANYLNPLSLGGWENSSILGCEERNHRTFTLCQCFLMGLLLAIRVGKFIACAGLSLAGYLTFFLGSCPLNANSTPRNASSHFQTPLVLRTLARPTTQ